MCATMSGWWTASTAVKSRVERVVALLHEREQVCGPAGGVGRGGHDGPFPWSVMRQFTAGAAEALRAAFECRHKASLASGRVSGHHLIGVIEPACAAAGDGVLAVDG
jgi:hypothetical protein